MPNIRNHDGSGAQVSTRKLLGDKYVLANIAMSAVMFCTDVLDGI